MRMVSISTVMRYVMGVCLGMLVLSEGVAHAMTACDGELVDFVDDEAEAEALASVPCEQLLSAMLEDMSPGAMGPDQHLLLMGPASLLAGPVAAVPMLRWQQTFPALKLKKLVLTVAGVSVVVGYLYTRTRAPMGEAMLQISSPEKGGAPDLQQSWKEMSEGFEMEQGPWPSPLLPWGGDSDELNDVLKKFHDISGSIHKYSDKIAVPFPHFEVIKRFGHLSSHLRSLPLNERDYVDHHPVLDEHVMQLSNNLVEIADNLRVLSSTLKDYTSHAASYINDVEAYALHQIVRRGLFSNEEWRFVSYYGMSYEMLGYKFLMLASNLSQVREILWTFYPRAAHHDDISAYTAVKDVVWSLISALVRAGRDMIALQGDFTRIHPSVDMEDYEDVFQNFLIPPKFYGLNDYIEPGIYSSGEHVTTHYTEVEELEVLTQLSVISYGMGTHLDSNAIKPSVFAEQLQNTNYFHRQYPRIEDKLSLAVSLLKRELEQVRRILWHKGYDMFHLAHVAYEEGLHAAVPETVMEEWERNFERLVETAKVQTRRGGVSDEDYVDQQLGIDQQLGHVHTVLKTDFGKSLVGAFADISILQDRFGVGDDDYSRHRRYALMRKEFLDDIYSKSQDLDLTQKDRDLYAAISKMFSMVLNLQYLNVHPSVQARDAEDVYGFKQQLRLFFDPKRRMEQLNDYDHINEHRIAFELWSNLRRNLSEIKSLTEREKAAQNRLRAFLLSQVPRAQRLEGYEQVVNTLSVMSTYTHRARVVLRDLLYTMHSLR